MPWQAEILLTPLPAGESPLAPRLLGALPAGLAARCRDKPAGNRLASAAAWGLLALALAQKGVPPAQCQPFFLPGGKPVLPEGAGYSFSLSHTAGLSACAISPAPCVGVDVERLRPFPRRVARRICSAGELALLERASQPDRLLFSLWCLKESAAKATGQGLGANFARLCFDWQGGQWVPLFPGWRLSLWEPLPGYLLALCLPQAP